MQELLARALRDAPSTAFLHPGDLAWSLGWPPQTPEELAAKVTVVEDGGAMVGWQFLDREDVLEWVDPAAPDPEAAWLELDAALERHPALSRSIREDDATGVARLRAAGFTPTSESMIAFWLDLGALPPNEPDDRVRPVVPGDDLGPRASVTRAAFRVDMRFDRYVRMYDAFTRSPAYPEGWDLVAWAEPGVAAACTIAWPNQISRVGNFEPVAAHPDLQRRGFASAVVREGVRRLRDAGMDRAMVRTVVDNHGAISLYRSLGFRDAHIERWFARS